MFWRPKIITNMLLIITITLTMITVLVILLLIPAITEGPNEVLSLQRTNCTLSNITYLNNYCLRDTSNDFTDLIYQPYWINCSIAMFNIITDLNSTNCSWIYPDSFDNNNDAFLSISQLYALGNRYACVIDTSQNLCYPDKNEVFIVSITISSLIFGTIVILIVYIILKSYYKKQDAINDDPTIDESKISK